MTAPQMFNNICSASSLTNTCSYTPADGTTRPTRDTHLHGGWRVFEEAPVNQEGWFVMAEPTIPFHGLVWSGIIVPLTGNPCIL